MAEQKQSNADEISVDQSESRDQSRFEAEQRRLSSVNRPGLKEDGDSTGGRNRQLSATAARTMYTLAAILPYRDWLLDEIKNDYIIYDGRSHGLSDSNELYGIEPTPDFTSTMLTI